MEQKLENILNFEKYNPNTPMYKEYSSSIYEKLITEIIYQLPISLAPTYSAFIEDIQIISTEFKNNDIKTNIDSSTSIINLSSIIELTDEIQLLIRNNPELVSFFFKAMILRKVHFLTVISLQSKCLIFSKIDIMNFLDKKIQFSQSEIAKEWEIDNDTLSKWFKIQYETNKYYGRKKIKLSEYLAIYNDFFVLDEDKRSDESKYMINIEQIDFYNSLALKGKTYSKNDIIEECFNPENHPSPRQYDEARKILLAKFSYYSEVDKFPTSIAFRLINYLRNFV